MFELAICMIVSCRVFQIETTATSHPPSFMWLSFVEKSLRSIGSKHIFVLCLNITAQKDGRINPAKPSQRRARSTTSLSLSEKDSIHKGWRGDVIGDLCLKNRKNKVNE